MAKHRTARQWASIVNSYERGNATLEAFCQHRGLAPSTLCYHLRRRRARPVESRAPETEPSPRLLEIKAPPAEPLLPADEAPAPGSPARPVARDEILVELPARHGPIAIHCQCRHLGEVLRQIPGLRPS